MPSYYRDGSRPEPNRPLAHRPIRDAYLSFDGDVVVEWK
jgi:hypothetical protein